MSDLTARRLAKSLETLGESAPAFATFLASYQRSLLDAGFTGEQALQLVAGMQAAILRGLAVPMGDEEPKGGGLSISTDAPRGN